MQGLFPLFLKLEGRRCLVVGADEIGEPKIARLPEAKRIVAVIAPHVTEKVQEWVAMERFNGSRRNSAIQIWTAVS
ncbi:MAG: NAD(P)-dependent oxidoreductase [Candidatus Acidiferrales bacterium]